MTGCNSSTTVPGTPTGNVAKIHPPIHGTQVYTHTLWFGDTEFGNAGCQDFALTDRNNYEITNATVNAHSSDMINAAQSNYPGAFGTDGPYYYAVMGPNATLYNIAGINENWPVPGYASQMINSVGDHVLSLVQVHSDGTCSFYEAGGVTGQSPAGLSTSHGHGPIASTDNMPWTGDACDGVSGFCGLDMGDNLTLYEASMNTGNSLNALIPIQHVIHMEAPGGVTCDTPGYRKNYPDCIYVGGTILLDTSKVSRPTTPNAAAVYDDMANWGIRIDDNGCCALIRLEDNWNNNGPALPTDVKNFIGSLHFKDFLAVNPTYPQDGTENPWDGTLMWGNPSACPHCISGE